MYNEQSKAGVKTAKSKEKKTSAGVGSTTPTDKVIDCCVFVTLSLCHQVHGYYIVMLLIVLLMI